MKRMTVLLFLSTALFGCAEQNTLAMFDCKIDKPDRECTIAGSKANPTPKLHKTGNGLNMTPKALCTEAGADVTVEITPAGSSPVGTVIVAAKNLSNAVWLLGSNNDPGSPDKINISIPEEVRDGNYQYVVIDTATGKCLDPRWDVQ